MRLVGPSGEQVGVVRVEDALRLAEEADLDLVEVAPDARPPVCKLMDYGKFKYESAMKARDARRNQANTQLKEIQFRPKIDEHDYATKMGHVKRFLEGGDKVKCIVRFRGREQSRPELGIRLLQRVAEQVGELATIESHPRQDGRNMVMVLAPTRRKTEVRSDQRRRREEARAARRQGKENAAEKAAKAQAEKVALRAAAPVANVPASTPEQAVAPKAATAAKPAVAKPVAAAKPAASPKPTAQATAAKPAASKSAVPKPMAPAKAAPKSRKAARPTAPAKEKA